MGAGKSHVNSAQCSKADFRNEETLNTIVRTHNTGKGKSRDHRRQQKGGCSKNNNKGFTSFVALIDSSKPQMENNSVWVCNTAMENSNNRNYLVDALTPGQQLEEIARAGEMSEHYRKSNGNGKSRRTCCICNCNCSRNKKMDYQTEQRNGLQSISKPIEECNKGRMAQLSEAEEIAYAIREYCCRAREKADRAKARNKRRCSGEFENNWRLQSMETDDDDEDTDTEPDIEIEVENYCCSAEERRVHARRGKCCKRSADMKRRGRKRREEDELEEEYSEEEQAVEEEHTAEEESNKRQHNAEEEQCSQCRYAQQHAKHFRCYDCKKTHSTTDQSDENEDKLDTSVEDIELEVQEERYEKIEKISALAPQSRRQLQKNEGQRPRSLTQERSQHLRESSRTKESEQKPFKQENKVLLKKTNLYARPKQTDKEVQTRQKPKANELQESKTKPQRSRSEKVQGIGAKNQEQLRVEDCRSCDCEREKAEVENRRKAEISRRTLDIEIVYENQNGHRTTLEDGTQSTRKCSRNREERATANEPQRRRNISGRGEEGTKSDKPQNGRNISCSSRGEKTTAEEQQSGRNINCGRQESQTREDKTTTDIAKDARVQSRERKPPAAAENEIRNRRRYERIKNKRNTRTQARKSCQQSIEDEKPSEEAAEQQPQNPQDEPNWVQTQSAEKTKPKIDCKAEEEKSEASEMVAKPPKAKQQSEKECQTEYCWQKQRDVPLTKCCEFPEDEYQTAYPQHSEQRCREEDRQAITQPQISLQTRLQEQMRANQSSCDPPPCCFPQFPCCCEQPMEGCNPRERPPSAYCSPPATSQMPSNCCPPPISPPPYCLPTTPPCCYEPPPCCYDPPPCYGQECPCCCQPIRFCYAAPCSYTNPGSSP
ncbi:PREDICTED: trichohyalin-like [Rhagoletis zephyria]|uniref:trichohyalin-like n=1 Tax=Rhagoletis zephyria TaxID=28612 RepID=UPI0008117699|nr:PREDICTED: trichohyalin-like [Rhagoletis zephyria]